MANALNEHANEDHNRKEYENSGLQGFRKITLSTIPIDKTKTMDVVAIIAAWLIALALVYMAIIKISIKFH